MAVHVCPSVVAEIPMPGVAASSFPAVPIDVALSSVASIMLGYLERAGSDCPWRERRGFLASIVKGGSGGRKSNVLEASRPESALAGSPPDRIVIGVGFWSQRFGREEWHVNLVSSWLEMVEPSQFRRSASQCACWLARASIDSSSGCCRLGVVLPLFACGRGIRFRHCSSASASRSGSVMISADSPPTGPK